jgi:hypothetical protein
MNRWRRPPGAVRLGRLKIEVLAPDLDFPLVAIKRGYASVHLLDSLHTPSGDVTLCCAASTRVGAQANGSALRYHGDRPDQHVVTDVAIPELRADLQFVSCPRPAGARAVPAPLA